MVGQVLPTRLPQGPVRFVKAKARTALLSVAWVCVCKRVQLTHASRRRPLMCTVAGLGNALGATRRARCCIWRRFACCLAAVDLAPAGGVGPHPRCAYLSASLRPDINLSVSASSCTGFHTNNPG